MILKLFGYDLFCNNLQHKKLKANLEVSEVSITYVTNRERTRVVLHTGAGHSNNRQILFKLFAYDIFCNYLLHNKFQANLKVSEVLITYVTNRGKARVMLHIEASHGNNCQIILKLFEHDIFCCNLQHKKKQRYHRY